MPLAEANFLRNSCAMNAATGVGARLLLLMMVAWPLRAEPLPDAASVLRRMQARLEELCAEPATNRYFYARTNVVEELDGDGRVKKRTDKVYKVTLAHGLPRATLVAVDGRQLSESEQRTRGSEEQRLRRTLTQDKAADQAKPQPWLTDELLERFHFSVRGRTNQSGRAVLMLDFRPQPDAATRSMADRIVNKISGQLWIDEGEAEIVRIELRMEEAVKFWGGILGQIDRFNWSMERSRSQVGVWFNERSAGVFQFRKLFSVSRFQFTEASSSLARLDPIQN